MGEFLGDPAISLLGEADAAREWIDNQRRNQKKQAMTPAFFRRWLKRERGEYASAEHPSARAHAVASHQLATGTTGRPQASSSTSQGDGGDAYETFLQRRLQEVNSRSTQRESGGVIMQRSGELMPLPRGVMRFLSQNEEEKTWMCATCGVIKPFVLGNGYYARRPCACEQHVLEQQRRQAVPRTLAEALTQAQIAQTYTWLGRKWAQLGLADKTFATFERKRQERAFGDARSFATAQEGVLALYGAYGVGKTHLLAALANARMVARRPCLFASAVTLFDAIQDRLGNNQGYHDLLRRAIETPLLLLDDVDKPKPSEFRQEVYYQIIDGRTRAGRPLALSSNCTPVELERFVGGAARSRLMMGIIPVQMSGTDYRMEMHSGQKH